jgi:hypothetical protein
MMTAYLVLASIGLLLALLVHGRMAPTILFTSLAALYYLTRSGRQSGMAVQLHQPPLAILVMLLLVSLVLERSPVLDHLSAPCCAAARAGRSSASVGHVPLFGLPEQHRRGRRAARRGHPATSSSRLQTAHPAVLRLRCSAA